MKNDLLNKILLDLKESRINLSVVLLFIPIAFFTYLFHEFGHWTFGEIFGNEISISLNNSSPISGKFTNESGALWSAIGGPLFTMIQAALFLIIVFYSKSVHAFSILFIAVFSRFFSLIFGGLRLQDEARIAAMLDMNSYLVAAVVLVILSLILFQGIKRMKFNLKSVGYFTVLGTASMLIVIGTNSLIS